MNDNTAHKRTQAVPRPELAPKVPRPPLTQDLRQRSLLRRGPAGSLLRVPRPAQIEDSDEAALSEESRLEPLPESSGSSPLAELTNDEPMSSEFRMSSDFPASSPALTEASTPVTASVISDEGAAADATANDLLPVPDPATLADVLADLDSERTAEFRVPEELLKQVRRRVEPGTQQAGDPRSSGVQSRRDAEALEALERGVAQQQTAAYRVPAVAIERALALGVANDEHRRQVRDACEKDTITPIQKREKVGEEERTRAGTAEADGELSIPPIQPSPSQLAPPRLPLDLLEVPSGTNDDDFSQELELAAVARTMDVDVAQAAFSSRFLLAVVGVLLVTVGVLVTLVVRGG